MQNNVDVIGITPAQRIKRLAKANKQWLALAGSAAGGFVMAGCFLFGGVSPFGVALVCALSGVNAMGAGLGAIGGYLLSADVTINLKYMAAIILVLFAKWLFGGRVSEKWGALAAVGTCFLCLGVCGGAVLALGDLTVYDLVMTVAELLLGCGAAYFFARTVAVLGSGLAGANRTELSCVTIAGCVVLMGFSSIFVKGLSVGRILGVLMILLCARLGREAGGAIAGIAAGVSVALATGDYAYVIWAFSFGGLAAGLFGQIGRIAAAVAFIAVNTGVSLLTMEFAAANTAIWEVFVASAVFIAIPGGWVSHFQLRGFMPAVVEANSQVVLRERLDDISIALREIGATTREVSKKLGKLEGPGPELMIERVAERVCGGCGMKTSCWQLRHSATVKALSDVIAMLRKDGAISREKMPRHFLQGCCRLEDLVGELRTQFNAYTSREGVQRKVGKVRSVLTDQFEGMAMMLDEVSGELCAALPFEKGRAERLEEYFSRLNLSVHRLSCVVDRYGRMKIELVIPNYQVARISKTKTTLDLCALLEADFDLPETIVRDKLTTLIFCEKATYTVDLGAYQLTGGKNRICGDAYDFIRNKGGCAHFVLSDGMGSGGSAAVDSAMACGLLIQLVNVGVGYDAALKMVNSALLVKSGDESLATIDVCALDLFSGKASFYKAGAAPTFIIKGGKAGYVESASLPAGILHGVSFEKSSVTLHEGDIIVMVSDGVTSTGSDWIKSELGGLRSTDMQRLCEKIAVTAKMRRTDGHEDDITVLAAALRKGS